MRIETIVIACFKRDVHLVRISVASVRYWYPDIDLWLLKDIAGGDFSTTEIEENFNVKVLETANFYNGWGFAKFEVFFTPLKRYLLLDSDTILLGRLLEDLEQFDDDFIVSGIEAEDPKDYVIVRDYVKTDKVRTINPDFVYPGYGVNTGQIVITNGAITREDLDQMVVRKNGRFHEKWPEIFNYADQGIINYILAWKKQKKEITVRYRDFFIWPGIERANQIDFESIKRKEGIPAVLHWAGIRPVDFKKFLRLDLLTFFEDYYYARIPGGKTKRRLREWKRIFILQLRLTKYKIFKMKYN